jgi:phosphoglycolate phosphatase
MQERLAASRPGRFSLVREIPASGHALLQLKETHQMKHILFDFDGTIADSEKTALEIMTTLADRHGFPRVSMEDVERLRRMTIAERFRELELPLRRLPGWAKEYNVLFQEAVLKVDPFPGMKDVLRALHEGGYAISILSSNAENNIRRFLDRHGLQFIEDVRCSHRVFSKDRMIKRLLRRYRLQHEDVVYVGDEHRDVVACKRAGVRVIWVKWGFDGEEAVKAENPDFIAETPADILRFVQEPLLEHAR